MVIQLGPLNGKGFVKISSAKAGVFQIHMCFYAIPDEK